MATNIGICVGHICGTQLEGYSSRSRVRLKPSQTLCWHLFCGWWQKHYDNPLSSQVWACTGMSLTAESFWVGNFPLDIVGVYKSEEWLISLVPNNYALKRVAASSYRWVFSVIQELNLSHHWWHWFKSRSSNSDDTAHTHICTQLRTRKRTCSWIWADRYCVWFKRNEQNLLDDLWLNKKIDLHVFRRQRSQSKKITLKLKRRQNQLDFVTRLSAS